jgi:enoyl-CoA hydratase/carnithine racemase
VTRVVPDEKLLATATETTEKLATKPAGALQGAKRLMKQATREQIKQAIRLENEEFGSLLQSADAKEAITAFLEKRPPVFNKAKTATTEAV